MSARPPCETCEEDKIVLSYISRVRSMLPSARAIRDLDVAEAEIRSRPPCEVCDFIGPELPCLATDRREAHRALADLGWTIADALRIQQFADWLVAHPRRRRP